MKSAPDDELCKAVLDLLDAQEKSGSFLQHSHGMAAEAVSNAKD